MKIDLHNHTTLSSRCSILDVRDLIRIARELGLDGICVTEHDTLRGGKIAEEIGREEGFLVIAGQEISTRQGDVLAFGVFEEGLKGIDIEELCRFTAGTEGLLIPAHPYRYNVNSVGDLFMEFKDCFVAVECLNGNCTDEQNRKARENARSVGLKMTGGSDSHSKEMVGRFYTEFDDDCVIEDLSGLLKALRESVYTAKLNPIYTGRNI